MEKIAAASQKMKEVTEKFESFRVSLNSAATVFEDLAEACAAVISQPYIEVDTSQA
jgi:hypothetical protein